MLGAGDLSSRDDAVANDDYGVPAAELVDADPPDGAASIDEAELERLRILARTPRLGRELDDRVLPAEAGLEQRAISFTKGCYPGQEPVARLHFRGHPNRGLRVVVLEDGELPAYDAELVHDGKAVGRITSAARDAERGMVALAYVRREVPRRRRARAGGRPGGADDRRLTRRLATRRSAPGTIRTCDLCLRRAALYPLSYGRSGAEV